MNVPAKVFEDAVAALDGFARVDNPALLAGDVGKNHVRHGSSSKPHESSPEHASELLRRHEDSLVTLGCGDPSAIVGEGATGHEQVDMGVPFKCTRPSVQHGEGADVTAEVRWVTAQDCKCLVGCPEEHRQQLSLVTANNEAQLFREREHHVKVRNRQKQIALFRDPLVGARSSALGTSSIVARVVLEVTRATGLAFGEMSTEGRCSAAGNVLERTGMAGQHGVAKALEVVRPVSTHHFDQAG